METTRQITINRHVMTTINSLAVFCEPKNGDANVIKGLRATRIENDRLMVVATNRYVAVKAIFDNVEFSDWVNWSDTETTQMWIDAETLKSATVFAKTQPDVWMAIARPTKDMPWSLSFAVSDNPNKPGPIHANISGNGYEISVLIQPNHALR